MIFVVLDEAARKGELLLAAGGLCRFHRRRDGVVVIREILVLPASRRQGLGRALVEQVQRQYPGAVLLARCPVDYAANDFWPAIGFTLAGTQGGAHTWQCPS
jgi:GNAT superfamily N-acetyltransferase